MYKLAKPLFLFCETSLHAGSGNDLGIVDLPVQRERHTSFPKIEGSGIKGCIREVFEAKTKFELNGKEYLGIKPINEAVSLAFGPEDGDKHSGALGFTDARILLFPVKSMRGVYAWITCPRVLERLKKDLELCGTSLGFNLPSESSTPKNCGLFLKGNKIVLEEFTFEIIDKDNEDCTQLAKWLAKSVVPTGNPHSYWHEKVKKDIVVLPDDDFRDFVNLSTEVITRTKINNKTGTVDKGQLFTEEYLPPETVLYSLALA